MHIIIVVVLTFVVQEEDVNVSELLELFATLKYLNLMMNFTIKIK